MATKCVKNYLLLGSEQGGLGWGAQCGIFVTSGRYTNPAIDFARDCGIKLVGGDELSKVKLKCDFGG